MGQFDRSLQQNAYFTCNNFLIFLIRETLLEFGPRESEGLKCSVKAYKLCGMREECERSECVNINQREPKKKTKKKKYCRNVSCLSMCVCPQYLDPVCDQEGKRYDNKECAECEGLDLNLLAPCLPSPAFFS